MGDDVISVRGLTMGFGDRVVMRDLDFTVHRGEVFVVMGASGCGKTTLLRHLLGLQEPTAGEVRYDDESFTSAPRDARERILRRVGVLFQGSALWTSMTLAENVALPLEQFTPLPASSIRAVVRLKLSLVGLGGFEDYYPWELSGGMQKRAGLARAISLDPEILLIDEPSASLDPPTARRLDALILQLRDALGTTAVVVTHDIATILGIGTRALFLDGEAQRVIAEGAPAELRSSGPASVRAFLGGSVARP
ncbi:ABC transporter ATP-binding protein [Anaeromyxobacter oryzae]|uniref:Polyamine ABC transporter ATP-binding protein n=1 Tax=Anaeromyxobacter oryzae TaxID=2918170 RepID=A0ABM7WS89_9BACT|nr:ATP-binding cassette domain-containing protein [Anaeromyxobacter oryzae]BDG02348.1 polyamine ABC transporter ATP-binding protein [Anaeromyxobacter oryzae]